LSVYSEADRFKTLALRHCSRIPRAGLKTQAAKNSKILDSSEFPRFPRFFLKMCYLTESFNGLNSKPERCERLERVFPLENVERVMKNLTTVFAAALLVVSANAEAGSKCKGSAVTHRASVSGHILTSAPAKADSKDIVDTAVSAGSFKTLVAAVKAAGLVDTLKGKGPFTVFAPTDEAFAKLPEGTIESLLKPENKAKLQSILTYHVVPGKVMASDVVKLTGAVSVQGQKIDIATADGKVTVDAANVVKTDIVCSNGVIHVIDSVILPADKDIVDTAVSAGSFKTLAAALTAAGLVETLKGEGPFTVFAPTDEAFAKLPEGTVESLLKPENKEKLVAVLTYHVVSGKVMASDVVKLKSAKTVNGKAVKIAVEKGSVSVDAAKVVATDIETSNGVIHVIDSVILP
jgi:transforming growth factor-beta-induced protein